MNGRTTPDFHLYWLTRSAGFFSMENTPFGLEHFSPDYMHYFYHLPSGLKAELPAQQANLYKGISSKTIRDIYERLYHRSIGGMPTDVTLAGHHQLQYAELLETRKQSCVLNTVSKIRIIFWRLIVLLQQRVIVIQTLSFYKIYNL